MQTNDNTQQTTVTQPEGKKGFFSSGMQKLMSNVSVEIQKLTGIDTDEELSQFLNIANGSGFGLQTQWILSDKLNDLDTKDTEEPVA